MAWCVSPVLVYDNVWISYLPSVVAAVGTFCCSLYADARPPTVSTPVLNLTAIQGQLMTFQIEASHPVQGQPLSFYVLKNTNSYMSITTEGLLK